MAHKVESGHKKDKVDQKQPMLADCNATLLQEGASNVALLISNLDTSLVCLCLRKTQSEDDDQDRRASAEPVKRAPSMGSGVDKSSRKGGRQKITESIALL